MKHITTFLFLLPTLLCQAQSAKEDNIRLYFDAYHSGDIKTLGDLLSENVFFKDLTSTIVGQELILEGKKATTNTLRSLFSGVSNLQFKSEFSFISAQFGVSAGIISYNSSDDNGQRKVSYKVLSIIELDENNKIKKHIEYADYESALKQLRE
ncbi:hypothetical protein BFP97_06070 [Roseivirga sp. 4D4]|uniref:nuclear transport factor 2 family protein n=1 Tax=Roseivirga sp. 4D4 TaxID=1889784 RepID=UPI000853EE9F|nr:nuclear transport factor 2 family protein [Roseivirga sp. 4D4]OEK01099.1 hypothetical protein BFP97_06070 [Roseivirga sp. 4D4]